MSAFTIRPAQRADCPAINEIYNHYVAHSTCTYQTEPDTLETRYTWFDTREVAHPVFACEIDNTVVG